jgi:anaerobic ribonucleoside-triphosphate reductase activating protein
MNLQINYIGKKLHAQGPGIRYTIWTQGCSIHCVGCSNIDTWDFSCGTSINTESLSKDILGTRGIDGVTITGGEPLDQFDAVLSLCKALFGQVCIFLTTGYTMGQLHHKGLAEILSFVDIICTGPFEQDHICSGEWKGSSNQKIVFITELGASQKNFPKVLKEIIIKTNGKTTETGFTV